MDVPVTAQGGNILTQGVPGYSLDVTFMFIKDGDLLSCIKAHNSITETYSRTSGVDYSLSTTTFIPLHHPTGGSGGPPHPALCRLWGDKEDLTQPTLPRSPRLWGRDTPTDGPHGTQRDSSWGSSKGQEGDKPRSALQVGHDKGGGGS